MKKITPNLWFNGNAREAAEYYVSVFPNSRITGGATYPQTAEEGLADFQQDMAGKDLSVEFELDGNKFVAINADDTFQFNEAVSFQVDCKDQEELDYYWSKLSAVPESEQCGWCKDKFGLSWQIIPENFAELMSKPGAYKTMMQQHKIVIAEY